MLRRALVVTCAVALMVPDAASIANASRPAPESASGRHAAQPKASSPPRMASPASATGTRADGASGVTSGPAQQLPPPGVTVMQGSRAESWTPFSHTTPNADGTMTAQNYLRPAFRRAGNSWVRTDGSLAKTPNDAAIAAIAPGAFRPVRFGRSERALVTFDTGRGSVTLSAPGLHARSPRIDGNVVTFADVAPSAELSYVSGAASVKQKVVLRDASAPTTYRFHLADPKGALGEAIPTADGGYVFSKDVDTDTAFALAAPVAYEASEESGVPGSATMSVTRAGDGWDVVESVNSKWLAGKAFPIVLDPNYTYTYTGNSKTTDCYVVSDNYANQGNCGAGDLLVGNGLGGTPLGTCGTGSPQWCITRSLLQFPVTNIPVGSTPRTGSLKLIEFNNQTNVAFNVSLYNNDTTFTDSATWNRYNSTCASPCWSGGDPGTLQSTKAVYADDTTHPSVTWGISTSTLQTWINTSANNHGVILRANPEARSSIGTTGHVVAFYSSEVASSTLWPVLTVNYDSPAPPAITKTDAPATGYTMSGSGSYARGSVVTYTITMTSAAIQNDVRVDDLIYSGLTVIPSSLKLDGATCTTCVLTTAAEVDIPSLDFNPTKTHTLKYDVLVTGNVDWSCAQALNQARTTSVQGETLLVNNIIQICDQALGLESWWSYYSRPVAAQSTAYVNAANGNLVVQQQDSTAVQAHGRLGYVLRRTYNSQDTQVSGLLGNMGAGWMLNLSEAGEAADATAPLGLIKPTIGLLTQQQPVTLVDRDGTRHVFTNKVTNVPVQYVMKWDSTAGKFVAATTGIDALVPKAISLGVSTAYNAICIDRSYKPPAGVHLSMWRYIAVNNGGSTTAPCAQGTGTAAPVVAGFVTMRTDRVRNEFDSAGRLISMADGAGNELWYVYSTIAGTSTTQLVLVYEPNSCTLAEALPADTKCRAYHFGYGSSGTLVTSLTDMTTRVAGPITSIVDPAGRTTRYAYDSLTAAFPVLTQVTNPDGTTVQYVYSSGQTVGRCAANAADVSIARQLCQITDELQNTTSFWYVSRNSFVNDIPLVGGLVDRRGTTATFTYRQAVDATDPLTPRTEVTVGGTQVRSWQKRDASGRFAQIQDYVGSTVYHQTEVAWDTGCRYPTAGADNNICTLTQRAFGSASVDSKDSVTTFTYNDEGQTLSQHRVGAGDSVTTYGYQAQYQQTNLSSVAYDHVRGNGLVASDGRPSSDTNVLYVLSDRIEALTPNGNAASTTDPSDGSEAEYKRYLTTYDVDANAAAEPNVRPVAATPEDTAVCTTSARTNTGLVCGEDGPYFRTPTSPTERPRPKTTYTYDGWGQRASMRTPKSNDPGDTAPDGSFVYHYYTDADRDLSGGTSSGGWLKAVEDPSGNFAAFAYDRAGNVMRTWDRDQTEGHALSEYPAATSGYAETRYGPFTGTDPAAAPWRYVLAERDVLCNWTSYNVDAHGNRLRTRPARGNTSNCNPDPAVTSLKPVAGSGDAYDTVRTFTKMDEVSTTRTPASGNATSRVTYDAFGNVTSEADPLADPPYAVDPTVTRSANGHVTAYTYDGANRRITVRRARTKTLADAPPNCRSTGASAPLPSDYYYCTTSLSYDGLDHVVGATDADGQVSRSHYDALGREFETDSPRNSGGVTTVRTDKLYDNDGHVVAVCRPRQFGAAASNPGATGTCDTGSVYADVDVYDYAGRVKEHRSHKDSTSVVSSFAAYDADGNTTGATDGNGHVVTAVYDLLGRKTSQVTPRAAGVGYTTTWTYSPSGDVTSVTRPGDVSGNVDSAPRITAFAYDADHRLTETVEASSSTDAGAAGVSAADGSVNVRSGTRYDADGNVVVRIDPRAYVGRTTAPVTTPYLFAMQYDNAGQLIAEYAPRFDSGSGANDLAHSSVQSSHCTSSNRPPATPGAPTYVDDLRDPRGQTSVCVVKYRFDAAGNRTGVVPASSNGGDSRVVDIAVTADNLVESVTSADPASPTTRIVTTSFAYDGTGRQTTVRNALPTTAVGAVATTTVTTFTGDGLLASETVTPNGSITHVTSYGYDLDGNRTTVTDAAGKTTTTVYAPDATRVSQTDPLQHLTTWQYDNAGNVVSTMSPNANANSGRASVTQYTYDNLVERTFQPVDAGTYRRTAYTYDAAGRQRVVTTDKVDGTGPAPTVVQAGGSQQYTYLPNDRVSRETGRGGETLDRSYDAAGHVLTATYTPAAGSAVVTTTGYYLDGRVRSVTESGRTTSYAYDGDGKLVTRDEQVGTAHTYTDYTYSAAQVVQSATLGLAGASGGITWSYDSAGRATAQTNGDGSGWTRTYNDDGTLKTQTVRGGGATNPVVADWRYGYDGLFRLTSQALDSPSTAACTDATIAAGLQCFHYDAAGRLDEFKDSAKTRAVGYDANGNRTSYDGTTTDYREDDSILRTTTGSTVKAHTYDAVGRLVTDGSGYSCYDGFDRLLEVRVGATSCTGNFNNGTTYTYDGAGRQITRNEKGASAVTSGTTSLYYDGASQSLVAEDKPGSNPDPAYAWAGSGPAYVSAGSTAQFLFDDGAGNVSTTVANGAAACKLRYDPFGNPLNALSATNQCSTGSTPSSLLYRASRRDPVTGNYQLGSRTYDPSKASFLTADTYRASEAPEASSVGSDPLTANGYSYANGDPVNLVDPSGHRPACIEDSPGGRLQCPNETDDVAETRTTFDGTPLHVRVPCDGSASVFGQGDPGRCRRESGFAFAVKVPQGPQPKYPSRPPENTAGANPQVLHFHVDPQPGVGRVTIGLFIKGCKDGLNLPNPVTPLPQRFVVEAAGNCRDFDTKDGFVSGPSNNKAWIEIDFDTGEGTVVVSPSCAPDHSKCHSAYSFGKNFVGSPGIRRRNRFKVDEYDDEGDHVLQIKFGFVNSWAKKTGAFAPAINGTIEFHSIGDGALRFLTVDRDPFPSLEIYQWNNGERTTLLQQGQTGLGPIVGLFPLTPNKQYG